MIRENIANIIIIGVGILIIVLFFWYPSHQESVFYCKDRCSYIVPHEEKEEKIVNPFLLRSSSEAKEAYWSFEGKRFETQEQCIDYCLTVK